MPRSTCAAAPADVEIDRRVEVGDGAIDVAGRVAQETAQPPVLGFAGLERDRGIVIGRRPLRLALELPGAGAFDVDLRLRRIDPQRALEVRQRAVEIAVVEEFERASERRRGHLLRAGSHLLRIT